MWELLIRAFFSWFDILCLNLSMVGFNFVKENVALQRFLCEWLLSKGLIKLNYQNTCRRIGSSTLDLDSVYCSSFHVALLPSQFVFSMHFYSHFLFDLTPIHNLLHSLPSDSRERGWGCITMGKKLECVKERRENPPKESRKIFTSLKKVRNNEENKWKEVAKKS